MLLSQRTNANRARTVAAPATPRPAARALAVVAMAIGTAGFAAPAVPADDHPAPLLEDPQGYLLAPCSGTESKPQSKIWYNHGSYWCIVDRPEGNRNFDLSGNRWAPQQGPDAILGGHEGRADVVWDGRELVVLLYDKVPALF